MLSKLRLRRPRHGTLVAYLALFVALGGSSYAAITVTGRNVKNSSLTGKDIKNSSLTTSDVRNGSLRATDFRAGQLPAGPAGATGAKGDKGDKGDQGVPGPTASARATKDFAPDVLLGPSSDTNVIDLDTSFAGASRLTLPFSARVMANATVRLVNNDNEVRTGYCEIALMNPANTGFSQLGQVMWETMAAGPTVHTSTPLQLVTELGPGTYNFRVVCGQIGGNANDMSVDNATLTVFAVAT